MPEPSQDPNNPLVKKNLRLHLLDWLYLAKKFPRLKTTQVVREIIHDYCNQLRKEEQSNAKG